MKNFGLSGSLAPIFGLLATLGELSGQYVDVQQLWGNIENHFGTAGRFRGSLNFWQLSANPLEVDSDIQSLAKSYFPSKSNFPKVAPKLSQIQRINIWGPSINLLKACQILVKSCLWCQSNFPKVS